MFLVATGLLNLHLWLIVAVSFSETHSCSYIWYSALVYILPLSFFDLIALRPLGCDWSVTLSLVVPAMNLVFCFLSCAVLFFSAQYSRLPIVSVVTFITICCFFVSNRMCRLQHQIVTSSSNDFRSKGRSFPFLWHKS